MTRRIVLAGGNGFIGDLLVKSFVAGNYEVVILTRSPVAGETAIRQVRWDGIGTIKLNLRVTRIIHYEALRQLGGTLHRICPSIQAVRFGFGRIDSKEEPLTIYFVHK